MNYFKIGLLFIFIYIIINTCKSKNMLGGLRLPSYSKDEIIIKNIKFPERQLIAHKDLYWNHVSHDDVEEDDYIFTYRYNPGKEIEQNGRTTKTLLNWRFEKISTGMDLIAYKGTKKVSLLTKIANGDTLWNNMGKGYKNIRCIYIKTHNSIHYHAILLESKSDTRILALRNMYSTDGVDPVTSYIISTGYVTESHVFDFIYNSQVSKDTKNSFLWSFEKKSINAIDRKIRENEDKTNKLNHRVDFLERRQKKNLNIIYKKFNVISKVFGKRI